MRDLRRLTATALLALVAGWSWAPAAPAHGGGNPHFESLIRGVAPADSGITLQVLNRDDRLLLTNHSGKDVLVEGYSDEPYARVLADGRVQVNTNSPAAYLNDDRYGAVEVPAHAKASAPPRWKEVDRTGRFEWHDHRIHWMARTTPPQVHDQDARTRIFGWSVPIRVGGTPGRITGELFWVPLPGGQAPLGAIFGVSAVLVVFGIAAVVIRRRRAEAAPTRGASSKEVW